MSAPSLSVIVRVRDEAAALARCLTLLSEQTVAQGNEVLVVDNDSHDDTASVARDHGARVLEISRTEFSFGRALNLGVSNARAELCVALSAHAFPQDRGWLERMRGAMEDPVVACACGDRWQPDGTRLERAIGFDASLARRHPEWGYSNAAGIFRASLWRERPFREDLPGAEDREWCRFWVLGPRQHVCVIDPELAVEHDHTGDPLLSVYRRARREAQGFRAFLPAEERRGALSGRVGDTASEWWSDTRFYANPWRARLSHRRAARLLGTFTGAR